MQNGTYSCDYEKNNTVYWIREIDLTIGVVFLFISVCTLLINSFVIYTFIASARKLQGTSLILLQVAANDFISGIIGVVFSFNVLSDRSLDVYANSTVGNILLCQVYGVLLDIIYIAAPLLLSIATALRVFAVLSPYRYHKVNTDYRSVPIVLSALSWSFGALVGLFPFLFGKWMCFSQTSGSCDYFVINVLHGNIHYTRVASLVLFVVPGNIAYLVIVLGGCIVIGKLFRQNRKTLKRTTTRMETVQNAKNAFSNRATSRRASDSELRMMQKEISVIKCTLILCATYFVAHFVTVSYNIVYIFQTDNSVFRTMSGNSDTGEVYLFAWFYLSHTIAGFVDGLVQIQCNNDMQKGIKSLLSRFNRKSNDFDLKGSVFNSINRFTTMIVPRGGDGSLTEKRVSISELGRQSSGAAAVGRVFVNSAGGGDHQSGPRDASAEKTGAEVEEKRDHHVINNGTVRDGNDDNDKEDAKTVSNCKEDTKTVSDNVPNKEDSKAVSISKEDTKTVSEKEDTNVHVITVASVDDNSIDI